MQVCPPLYRQKDKNDYRLTGFEVVHMLVLFFEGIYIFLKILPTRAQNKEWLDLNWRS